MNNPVQTYEYLRHVFGAEGTPTSAPTKCKSSPTNYALKLCAIDNEDEFSIAAKAIQNNFYMDDFIKSVEAPDEAINVFT